MHNMPALIVNVARLSLWLIILVLLFAPLERLFAVRKRDTPRAIAADLGYFYLNGLLPSVLLALPLSLLAALVARATPALYTDAIDALPFAVKIAAGLFVSELGAYWGHRLCHRSPFLWRFHALHHSAEHLDWMVNMRAHPIDMVFTRLCGLVPLYALGLAQPSALNQTAMIPIYVTLIGTVWSFFIHANVRWRFGVLEQIIATPAFHHWHHTNGSEHRDRNFAALMPVFDRLFGTLHLPVGWPPCYGVDEPVRGGLARELLLPINAVLPSRETPRAGGENQNRDTVRTVAAECSLNEATSGSAIRR